MPNAHAAKSPRSLEHQQETGTMSDEERHEVHIRKGSGYMVAACECGWRKTSPSGRRDNLYTPEELAQQRCEHWAEDHLKYADR